MAGWAEQDHRVAADKIAVDTLAQPQHRSVPRTQITDAGVELHPERAAFAFESLPGPQEFGPRVRGNGTEHEPSAGRSRGRQEAVADRLALVLVRGPSGSCRYRSAPMWFPTRW